MKVIQVFSRSVYGRETLYPANEVAKALAEIAGTKTLAPAVINLAKTKLGYAVEVVQEQTTLVKELAAS